MFVGGGTADFLWAAELAALPGADATRVDSNRHQFNLYALTMLDRVYPPWPAIYPDELGVDYACIPGTMPLGTVGRRWAEDRVIPRLYKIAHPHDPTGSTIGEEVVMSQFPHHEPTPLFLGPLTYHKSLFYDMPSFACSMESSIQAALGRFSLTCGTPKSPISRKIASFGGCMSRCSLLVIETCNSLFRLEFLNSYGEKRGSGNTTFEFPTWVLIDDETALMEEMRQFCLSLKTRYFCVIWMPPDPNLYNRFPQCATPDGRIIGSPYEEECWVRVGNIAREIGIRVGRSDWYHGDSYAWRAPWNVGASQAFVDSQQYNQPFCMSSSDSG